MLVVLNLQLIAKDNKYPVASISEKLLDGASSVVRYDETVFEIDGIAKASESVVYAVTILEESAYDRAIFVKAYDKFSKIKSIRAAIYDQFGKQVKKIKSEDITDMSVFQGASSIGDSRVKYFDPDYKFFPFTIEYSFEIQHDGLLTYPSWNPYNHYEESIEHSSLKVITDPSFTFRYYPKNGAPDPDIVEEDKKNYTWEKEDLEAIEYQHFSHYDDRGPSVFLAPIKFKIGGEEGSNESWEEFSQWIGKLNKGQNNLSDEAKDEIKALVKDIDQPEEKIKTLYEYMQNRTRYVSIQLGIGGWKPFDANTVERLGYGDCKALSFYMKSILEVVDIPSNYVLVRAGKNSANIIAETPGNQFNHAFLMVPMADDTIWLECTDQQIPFDYLGSFTDDRDVLVIQENGGKIVRTPGYAPEENYVKSKIDVKLYETGNADVRASTSYGGAKYMDVFGYLMEDKKTIENKLNKKIDIKDFTIADFAYENKENAIDENLAIQVMGFARKNRNKLIMPLNLMNKLTTVPKKDDERNVDVFIRRSFSEIDDITFHVPSTFHAGSNPEPVTIESRFGKYKVDVAVNDKTINYHRELILYKGTYPPSDYNELIDFLSAVSKADRMKILLIGST